MLADLNIGKVLFVTDPGIAGTNLHAPAMESVKEQGIEVELFDGVDENPTDQTVERCVALARKFRAEALVGVGGGSSLDTAKAANFLLTSGGRIQDYWGRDLAKAPMLPFIAIPTTTGTGSECQSFAIIQDSETHQKMACGDHRAFPTVAVLDPELTLSQPPGVRAATGIDALSHALESMVSRQANPFSQSLSREAFRLIAGSLGEAMRYQADLDAHRRLQLGAAFAGMAIEASMLGAAHAMANPLTAHFGVVHGRAIGLVLPTVMKHNASQPEVAKVYRELAIVAGLASSEASEEEAVALLIDEIDALRFMGGLPRTMEEAGIQVRKVRELAAMASEQWTGGFNPVTITEASYQMLYESIQ